MRPRFRRAQHVRFTFPRWRPWRRPTPARGGSVLRVAPEDYFGVPPLVRSRATPADLAASPPTAPRPAAWQRRVPPWPVLCALLVGFVCAWPGCSAVSSTARRSGAVAVGSALGGLTGYAASGGDARATGGGAVAGGLLTQLGLGRDPAVLQEGFDQGYVRGQSDAIKRHYFLRQALERRPLAETSDGGHTVTYVLPGPSATAEGLKLAPHAVATVVKE